MNYEDARWSRAERKKKLRLSRGGEAVDNDTRDFFTYSHPVKARTDSDRAKFSKNTARTF